MMSVSDPDSDWTFVESTVSDSDSVYDGMSDDAFTLWAFRIAELKLRCVRAAFFSWMDAVFIYEYYSPCIKHSEKTADTFTFTIHPFTPHSSLLTLVSSLFTVHHS